MNDSQNPLRSVGALLLAAATLTCSEAVGRAQPTTIDKRTLCMDTGRNITFATAVGWDNSGNTYVTGGKRLNNHAKGVSQLAVAPPPDSLTKSSMVPNDSLRPLLNPDLFRLDRR